MWEVMSYGERPYWNWSNQDVIKSIEKVLQVMNGMAVIKIYSAWISIVCDRIVIHFPDIMIVFS